jgi:hypothetical protein
VTDADPAAARSGAPETSACPGCGAVLAVVPGLVGSHPGASASCAGLFAVTVRGLREEAAQDAGTASLLQLATDAYDAQHLLDGEPAAAPLRVGLQVGRGLDPVRAREMTATAPVLPDSPARWAMTVADLAADLDVVDLPTLVRTWADAVWTDWAPYVAVLHAPADTAGPS